MPNRIGRPTGKRVLVVEDEPRLLDLLSMVLRQSECTALLARTAEQAWQLVQDDPPVVAILDINLPGQSGLDLLAKIRGKHPDVAAIIITGFGDLDAAKRAIRLGVSDFLTKPFDLGELEAALQRALNRTGDGLPTPAELADEDDDTVPDGPPNRPLAAGAQPDAGTTLEEYERRHILDALKRNGGNRTAAAAELGISRRKLHYRIREYMDKGLMDA
jgi:DNA-binding NtrC family response regulator